MFTPAEKAKTVVYIYWVTGIWKFFLFPVFFLLFFLFWTVVFSVFSSICTSAKAQESWTSHREKLPLTLLFNHFQSMLWGSEHWYWGLPLRSAPGTTARRSDLSLVICHCIGTEEMAALTFRDIVSFHNYISPVFTDCFKKRERKVTHVVQYFRSFFF